MIATKTPPQYRPQKPRKDIPESLIYEIMDGEPVYYRGYEAVLAGQKTPEEIMGCSSLQSLLVNYFIWLVARHFDETRFTIFANESGLHLDHRNNLSGDFLLYETATLPFDRVGVNYADFPPKIAIEIDTVADFKKFGAFEIYAGKKTKKLLDFGTEKVIWVVSKMRRVWMAERGNADWVLRDWNLDIELLEGVFFNVGAYLAAKGVVLPDED